VKYRAKILRFDTKFMNKTMGLHDLLLVVNIISTIGENRTEEIDVFSVPFCRGLGTIDMVNIKWERDDRYLKNKNTKLFEAICKSFKIYSNEHQEEFTRLKDL
jgi:hypothetical protein